MWGRREQMQVMPERERMVEILEQPVMKVELKVLEKVQVQPVIQEVIQELAGEAQLQLVDPGVREVPGPAHLLEDQPVVHRVLREVLVDQVPVREVREAAVEQERVVVRQEVLAGQVHPEAAHQVQEAPVQLQVVRPATAY